MVANSRDENHLNASNRDNWVGALVGWGLSWITSRAGVGLNYFLSS